MTVRIGLGQNGGHPVTSGTPDTAKTFHSSDQCMVYAYCLPTDFASDVQCVTLSPYPLSRIDEGEMKAMSCRANS